jgi:thiol-disulfide isomerase/thioredoxin
MPLVIILISQNMAISQIAPNFSFTDLDSNTLNLYEELSKGKTVVLDFFFADCKPCKELTPQLAKLNSEWKDDTAKVMIWGISDRDNNFKLKKFENDYGVNYPSCGTEGGGDTITALYSSWFTFFGWPTYAVICPSREIHWNVEKGDSFKSLDSIYIECKLKTNTETPDKYSLEIYPNPANQSLRLQLPSAVTRDVFIELFEMNGKKVELPMEYNKTGMITLKTNHLKQGIYILTTTLDGVELHHKIIIER